MEGGRKGGRERGNEVNCYEQWSRKQLGVRSDNGGREVSKRILAHCFSCFLFFIMTLHAVADKLDWTEARRRNQRCYVLMRGGVGIEYGREGWREGGMDGTDSE